MIVDTAKTGKIKLRNVTDKPITVIKAIPGCGCTTAGWPKEPIPAGEAAEVEITLKPGSKAGIPLHKKVTFQLQDHAPVVLSVTGNIPAYVTVTPELLDAPSTNKPGNDGVKISSVDNTAFKVVSITPPIAMEEDAKAAADNAKTEHQIRIDWKKWEETGKGIKLVFALDHPKAPTMGVLIKRPISDTPSQRPPNAPPVAADKPGANNLVLAARQGDLERVKLELANGTDVNLVDRAQPPRCPALGGPREPTRGGGGAPRREGKPRSPRRRRQDAAHRGGRERSHRCGEEAARGQGRREHPRPDPGQPAPVGRRPRQPRDGAGAPRGRRGSLRGGRERPHPAPLGRRHRGPPHGRTAPQDRQGQRRRQGQHLRGHRPHACREEREAGERDAAPGRQRLHEPPRTAPASRPS